MTFYIGIGLYTALLAQLAQLGVSHDWKRFAFQAGFFLLIVVFLYLWKHLKWKP